MILAPLLLAASFAPASAATLAQVRAAEADEREDYAVVAAALPMLEAKARTGDAEASYLLSVAYKKGMGVPVDPHEELTLLKSAANKGYALALQDYAFALDNRLAKPDHAAAVAVHRRAVAAFERDARTGDRDAMVDLAGWLESSGFDSTPDPDRAEEWHGKARAAYLAAYLPAAQRGDAEAQYQLGRMLILCSREAEARTEATKWLTAAAAQGRADALLWLGYYTSDDAQMVSFKERAAALGSAQAASDLAWLYWDGHGATPDRPAFAADPGKAHDWALKADSMGHRTMGCIVADYYLRGVHGLEKDSAKALELARPRAAAGIGACLSVMGAASASGDGVPLNEVEALKFYLLAAERGDYDGKAGVAALKKKLTAENIAEAAARAKRFRLTAMPLPVQPSPAPAAPSPVAELAPSASAPAAVEPPAAAPALPERPDDYALIVGIEHYRGLPAADYAEADAASVRDRLVSLGFPEQNVISLTGDQATRSSLQAYLEEWLPKNVNERSRVFFYFSGHGSPDPRTGKAYLVPYDGNPEFLKSTAYPLTGVYAALAKLPAKQVIVALDSCFSGAGGRSVLPKGARPLVTKTALASPAGGNMVVLAAAAGDEISGELDDQGHGAFTYYLLEGLSGAAGDKNGAITAGGLERYLKPKVAVAAHRQNRDQTPQLMGDPATVLFKLPPR